MTYLEHSSKKTHLAKFKLCLAMFNPLTAKLIFTHLKLCLADAIHNFKWVKIIQAWHHYNIFFVGPLHTKPGMENGNGELLLSKYRPIIMVGLRVL